MSCWKLIVGLSEQRLEEKITQANTMAIVVQVVQHEIEVTIDFVRLASRDSWGQTEHDFHSEYRKNSHIVH